jgi:hypothetical protein
MGRVRQSTLQLRQNMDAFIQEFEAEFRKQATKGNDSSERRMRSLLRKFSQRVYIPYREATLNRADTDDDAGSEELPF